MKLQKNNIKLQVNGMLAEDEERSQVIEDILELMMSMKNSYGLKGCTSLYPALYARTRFSGNFHDRQKFLKLLDALITLHCIHDNKCILTPTLRIRQLKEKRNVTPC